VAIALAAMLGVAGCRGNGGPASGGAASGAGPRAPVAGSGSASAAAGAEAPAARPTDARPRRAPPRDPPPVVPVPAAIAAQVKLVKVLGGLHRPVLIAAAPGDTSGRLFVIEQRGKIVVVRAGKVKRTPLLDLTGRLSTGNEEGVLGLAFHPRFAENHKLYVDYTDRARATHVVEYRTRADDPDQVDPATARELLKVDQPYSNHNAGNLTFGPDGKLWVGLGDGGSAGDPHGNGQNPRALLGKMLRIDVDAAEPEPEIVAMGLRNPWRYAFDPKTGDLYIGDVGQDKWENVYAIAHDDLVGHNFGWNVREGRHCYAKHPCDRPDFTPPVVDYAHGEEGCSVTGGFVYRGAALPALDGVYFYGDYCSAKIKSFRWTPEAGATDHWAWKEALDPDGDLTNLSSFGVDARGELYLVSLDGNVFELVPRR